MAIPSKRYESAIVLTRLLQAALILALWIYRVNRRLAGALS